MSVDAQSARDDLAFLRSLVERGDGLRGWGESYLAAGLVYGGQMLLHVGQIVGWLPGAGPAMLLIAGGPTLVFLALLAWINARHRADRPSGGFGRAIGATFGAMGMANLALAAVIGSVAWREHSWIIWLIYPCAVFVLQGAAWLVAALVRRRGWMALVAAGWFVSGLAMGVMVTDIAAYILIAGLGIWTCMALPGWIMVRQARQSSLAAAAT